MLEIFIGVIALAILLAVTTFIGHLFRPHEHWAEQCIIGVLIIGVVICGLGALQGIGNEILESLYK